MSSTLEEVISQHRGRFGGRPLYYLASVGRTKVRPSGPDGPAAVIVSTDYVAHDSSRPVVFLCNGGPIVSSAPLHMGAFGPRRASSTDGESVDNEHALLDVADLVFYDPPGTGYSRVAEGTDLAAFAGVMEDASLMAAWVQQWLHDHHRRRSPVVLVGEGYGAIRVAVVAAELAARGVRLGGVCLVRQTPPNVIEICHRPANLTGHLTALPTLAAVVRHQARLMRNARTVEQVIAEAAPFIATEPFAAVPHCPRLVDSDPCPTAQDLAKLTAVAADLWIDQMLRLIADEFREELVSADHLAPDKYEARWARPPAPVPDRSTIEACLLGVRSEGIRGARQALDAAVDTHLRDFLKADLPEEYRRAAPELALRWSWAADHPPFGDWVYGSALTEAMRILPRLHVLVCMGIHDMPSMFGATEHTSTVRGWLPERVRLERYVGGDHTMHSEPDSLACLAADVRTLIGRCA